MSDRDPLAARLDAETPELAALRAANATLQRQLGEAKAKTEALVDAVETAARDAAVTVGRPRVAKAKPSTSTGSELVALVHATDWQLGKRTETYSSNECARRIALLGSKVARIAETQRAAHKIDRCVLMLGGDMVEGVSIFPGQAFEVDSTMFEQLFRAASVTEQLIVDLLTVFSRVDVVAEWGNHGRLGRRGDMPGSDNVDRLLYRIVQERTESDRVSWQHSSDWHQMVEIGEYKAMLAHGDEIKSFGGNTPSFGILRKSTAWSSGVVDTFHDVYLGHFHTPMTLTMPNGGQIYLTGSPESDNAYAAEFVAARGRPSQRLHFVDPGEGRVAASYLIWLD